jgi:hypothetical protein
MIMSNYKKEDVAVLSLLAFLLVFDGYYASMLIIGPPSPSSTLAPILASPDAVTVSSVGTTPPPSTITSCDQIDARNFPIDPNNDPYNLDGDGDGIACEDPDAPAQHAVPPPPLGDDDDNATTTTPPPGSSSSPFIEPPPPEERGQINNATTGNVTTLPTTAANGTTKTDGLLRATINSTRYSTNQTILINGTLGGGEGAGAGGKLFVELKNPRNETLLYDSANMATGSFDTPFSYTLVAGDLEKNNGGVTTTRTVFKPMNETADNYTMVVGYDAITSSANNNNSSTTRSSEVQFAFAYEHVVARGGGVLSFPPSPATGNATITTNATTPEEPEPEPEAEPVQPPVQQPLTREPEPVPQPQPEEEEEGEESEEEQLERLRELLQEEIDDEEDDE